MPTPARSREPSRWLPIAILAVFPLVAARARFLPVGDPDAFWHILTGEWVWSRHQVTGHDPFGTFTTQPWVAHEWLPEILMAGSYRVWGLAGVAWLAFAGTLALFAVLYHACRARADPLAACLAAMLGWVGASGDMGPRPQIATLVLLAVTAHAWRRTVLDGRPRWWLVPMTWVWACSHGLWFSGPLLGLCVVLGLAATREPRAPRLGRLLAVPVASVAVAALTPAGLGLFPAILRVGATSRFVTEFGPPDVRSPYVAATVLMLVLVAVGWARAHRPVPPAALLTWLVALGWTLLYARTVALGAVVIAPYAADTLQSMVPLRRVSTRRTEKWVLAAGVAVALAACAALAPRVAGSAVGMPTTLDDPLSRLPGRTVVLNEFSVGGWLMLEHPQLRPVIDPRTDLYSTSYLREYGLAVTGAPGWRDFVTRTDARAALLTLTSPLPESLETVLGWHVVARAGGYVLLAAP